VAHYNRASEIIVSSSEAITMMNDPSLVVVMSIPRPDEDRVEITYWSKDNGQLPPWIIVQKAA
jgi:hypothetical protein